MNIETHLAPRYAVLRMSGDFETYAIADFLEAVRAARESGRNFVVLNLRRVKFVNSTAIGAVLRARKELKAAGGGLALARSSELVQDLFRKLGLDVMLPSFSEEEDAAEAMLAEREERHLAATPGEGEAALFFRFFDQERANLFGARGVGAAEISLLDLEGITFTWDPRLRSFDERIVHRLFAPGTELELKFRLPLYSKSTYYVSHARVASLNLVGGRARVRAIFSGLADEAAKAVRQYVADMALVREEIQQARGNA
ncbi:MAG: anti-sigma factor antagonist [Planctomycetota bacterium]|nr:MAG: anti-sigma factor antagonist [Planctomycetota bacterium]